MVKKRKGKGEEMKKVYEYQRLSRHLEDEILLDEWNRVAT